MDIDVNLACIAIIPDSVINIIAYRSLIHPVKGACYTMMLSDKGSKEIRDDGVDIDWVQRG
jgi:hypothetical protein